MDAALEKRISCRHKIQGVITLHTSFMTPNVINAYLLNHSEEGICFSSTKKLVPGTTILFRSVDNQSFATEDDDSCQLRSISMVTIKWCQESSRSYKPVYIYGANYVTHT